MRVERSDRVRSRDTSRTGRDVDGRERSAALPGPQPVRSRTLLWTRFHGGEAPGRDRRTRAAGRRRGAARVGVTPAGTGVAPADPRSPTPRSWSEASVCAAMVGGVRGRALEMAGSDGGTRLPASPPTEK